MLFKISSKKNSIKKLMNKKNILQIQKLLSKRISIKYSIIGMRTKEGFSEQQIAEMMLPMAKMIPTFLSKQSKKKSEKF